MDGFDRIYDLHKLLQGRKTAMPLVRILEEMECSRATFNRIKKHMTEFLGAPIEYRRDEGGYRYGDGAFELLGTWFNEQELQALMMLQALLANLGEGLLHHQLAPLEKKLAELLKSRAIAKQSLTGKVVVVNAVTRPITHRYFGRIAEALIQEYPLKVQYFARARGEVSRRIISPQRLVAYKGSWYLDVWCHTRKALRTFAIENIHKAERASEPFHALSQSDIDSLVKPTFGIFSGKANAMAELLFDRGASVWASAEQWHPEQKLSTQKDGTLKLHVPYDEQQPIELVREILRYGAGVEVISPLSLRAEVSETLQRAAKRYATRQ